MDDLRLGQLLRAARLRRGWRQMARLLSARHGVLAESVTRALSSTGWDVYPEVSFSIWGERGIVDLLAWHAEQRALLVIELKTAIVDLGEMLGTLARKRRLARQMAADRGLQPMTVSVCLIVEERTMNRSRARSHHAVLRAALPADGRTFRAWLARPDRPLAALSFWRVRHQASTTRSGAGIRRVMVPRARLSPPRSPAA